MQLDIKVLGPGDTVHDRGIVSKRQTGAIDLASEQLFQLFVGDVAQAALGNLLGRQGRWAQALGPLTLAQSLAPDSAPHAYNLAVALDQARRYDDALQMYRYTLQLGAAGVSAQALERRIAELQGVAAR